jgi:hypothetical protein
LEDGIVAYLLSLVHSNAAATILFSNDNFLLWWRPNIQQNAMHICLTSVLISGISLPVLF